MRVGIIGAGHIAGKMATTISALKDVENYAVASRDIDKAKAFCDKFGTAKAYGSYEDMLNEESIDLVYIALPHSHHCRWSIEALNAGKNVLCEKPAAVNTKQAKDMIAAAQRNNRLFAEAMWTRYMPSRQIIDEIVSSGELGEIVTVASDLGYRINMNPRMMLPELAGGCLLDLTVYNINFSSMVHGNSIKRISASMIPTETGVDGQNTVMMEYDDGVMASMFTTMFALTERRGLICGTEGYVTVENLTNPQRIKVYAPDRVNTTVIKDIAVPPQITGYEYEVLACMRAIEQGRIECGEMPHSETIEMVKIMDEIRRQFGVVYPFEQNR